jgi:hypothetical protein
VRNNLQQQNYLPSVFDGLDVEIALLCSFRKRSPPILIFSVAFLRRNLALSYIIWICVDVVVCTVTGLFVRLCLFKCPKLGNIAFVTDPSWIKVYWWKVYE